MRILLVKTSALGDVVHALPVLRALRVGLPRARIAWLVEEAFAPLLEGHPDLDELLVVRTRAWRRRGGRRRAGGELLALLQSIRDFSPDVALDLMGNHKGGVLAALSLADRRIGWRRADRREPSSALWIRQGLPARGLHAVDRNLSLLAGLDLEVAPAAVDFGGALLPGTPPGGAEEPFVFLHPGAGWGNKRYRPEDWVAVAVGIHQRSGLRTLVAAGPGEESLAAAIVEASGGAAWQEDLPGLPRLVGRLRSAALVLGGDTGPLHLAHALEVPVLMLMGPTDPARNGPYGAPERALVHLLPCSFCHRRMEHTQACLLELRPTQVVDRAIGCLAGGSTR